MVEGPRERRWAIATGCLVVAAISCVPLYIGLQIVGGYLSMLEQNYRNAHRTPVRYELPAGFLGKGEVDFNVPTGGQIEREGDALVFRFPTDGQLRLRDGYEAVPRYIRRRVFLGNQQIPERYKNGNDLSEGRFPPGGVGFYDRMNDDANPANHYDDANRQAFFVGTQAGFERGVKAGKIKPWD